MIHFERLAVRETYLSEISVCIWDSLCCICRSFILEFVNDPPIIHFDELDTGSCQARARERPRIIRSCVCTFTPAPAWEVWTGAGRDFLLCVFSTQIHLIYFRFKLLFYVIVYLWFIYYIYWLITTSEICKTDSFIFFLI